MRRLYYGPILSEDHWLHAGEVIRLAEFVGEGGSSRRWQLFACHCCWRVQRLLSERGCTAVVAAERQAEGLATEDELREALAAAREAELAAWGPGVGRPFAHSATAAAAALTSPRRAFHHVLNAVRRPGGAESAAQCDLFRDLFANPFRPFVFDPAWRTPTVLAIAAHVYDREAFDELPILADALDDAGCDDSFLLAHLRERTRHYRGCWALDAALSKE